MRKTCLWVSKHRSYRVKNQKRLSRRMSASQACKVGQCGKQEISVHFRLEISIVEKQNLLVRGSPGYAEIFVFGLALCFYTHGQVLRTMTAMGHQASTSSAWNCASVTKLLFSKESQV